MLPCISPLLGASILIHFVAATEIVHGNSPGSNLTTLYSGQSCGRTVVPYGATEHRVSAPWTAILFLRTTQTNGVHVDWISGVIIGPSTVLTRGRQFWEAEGSGSGRGGRPRLKGFKPQNLLVGVGVFNRKSFQIDDVAQIIEVKHIRPHAKSYQEHSEYDIAILHLTKSINMSERVQPICVQPFSTATNPYEFSSPILSAPQRLSGYRHWPNFRVFASRYKLKSEDVCDEDCQVDAPSSTEQQFENGGPPCPPRRYLQDQASEHDQFGDFLLVGASLEAWLDNRWHLAGIVTKTYGCDSQFKHFVSLIATSVNLDWINANIRNGGSRYSCMDGSGIDTSLLCDGRVDCLLDGGSDEGIEYCAALNCPTNSSNSHLCNTATDGAVRIRNSPNSVITIRGPLQGHAQRTASTPASTLPKAVGAKPVTAVSTAEHRCAPFSFTTKEKEGVRYQCRQPGGSFSSTGCDCSETPQPSGTIMLMTCLPHYKSGTSISFSEMVCGGDGNWHRNGSHLACVVECGVAKTSITGLIVNGTETESSSWPWNAALFLKVQTEFKYFCGATLITTRSLVTAAHCAEVLKTRLRDVRVVVAPISSKLEANLNSSHSQILQVDQMHVIEHYVPSTFDADIAVVKTAGRVQISDHVYPACFPFPGRENEQVERFQTSVGAVGVVVGFGTDEDRRISGSLKVVKLPIVSVRDCAKVLDVFPTATQLCAGYTTGVGLCNGDSGAGLLFQEEDARKLYFLQAIVSYGQLDDGGRCNYNRYSIFTRVGAFKEWVERIVSTD